MAMATVQWAMKSTMTARRDGQWRNGIRRQRRQWLRTTGNEVDNYGVGAMGDNDNNNGDGTERRNNQDTHTYFRGK
jgi:hypothetical protein